MGGGAGVKNFIVVVVVLVGAELKIPQIFVILQRVIVMITPNAPTQITTIRTMIIIMVLSLKSKQ